MGLHPSMNDCNNLAIALFIITGLFTSVRTWLKFMKGMWWWDDTFAVFAMLIMSFFVAGSSVLTKHDTVTETRAGYYLLVVGYYIPVWSARLSILLSIIHIAIWPNMRRKILRFIGIFFAFLWAFVMVQTVWVCEITLTAWKNTPNAICDLGDAVPIIQAMATFLGDLLLIAPPLWLLRSFDVDPHQRFRLYVALSVSVATLIASLTHMVLATTSPGPLEFIFGVVEVFVTLTACHGTVLIPAVVRLFSNDRRFNEELPSAVHEQGFNNAMVLGKLDIYAPVIKVEVTVDREEYKNRGSSQDSNRDYVAEDNESISVKLPSNYGIAM